MIYIRMDLYYLNPMLLVFGYRIYEANKDNTQVILISTYKIECFEEIKSPYIELGNSIYLITKE